MSFAGTDLVFRIVRKSRRVVDGRLGYVVESDLSVHAVAPSGAYTFVSTAANIHTAKRIARALQAADSAQSSCPLSAEDRADRARQD